MWTLTWGPEMKSTGECLGIAESYPQALLKAFKGANMKVPKKGSRVIITVKDEDKGEAVGVARELNDLGVELFATQGTYEYLKKMDVDVQKVNRLGQAPPQPPGYDPVRHRGHDYQHAPAPETGGQ